MENAKHQQKSGQPQFCTSWRVSRIKRVLRNLAQRSADAAKEIKVLIETSVERIGQGTTLADRAGATMQQVVSAITNVSTIVEEMSSASREQNEAVRQASEAVTQIDETTQQNAALVEESAAAAESLRSQAVAALKNYR